MDSLKCQTLTATPAEPGVHIISIDFLLRRGGEYLAIEVKPGHRYNTGMLAGLKSIVGLDHLVRRIVVYLGEQNHQSEDGVEIWTLDTFLEKLSSGTLWP
jgi:hypothetical protein